MARLPLARLIEEPHFAKIVARELGKQKRSVIAEAQKDLPQLDDTFWQEHEESLAAAMLPVLVGIYDRAVGRTLGAAKQEFIGELASRAIRWAKRYAGELAHGITRTTQRIARDSLAEFIATPGLTLRDLTDMLSTAFGVSRAQTIAVTEFTRAHYEGGREAAEEIRKVGFEMVGIWRTANDERVCPICGPLEGVRESPKGQWGADGIHPPAHPNCRCDIAYELV